MPGAEQKVTKYLFSLTILRFDGTLIIVVRGGGGERERVMEVRREGRWLGLRGWPVG